MKKYFSTFVGIPLPPKIREDYNRLLDELKEKCRLFDLANRYTPHITLNFFGEKSEQEMYKFDSILENNLGLFKDIEIRLSGLDQFSPESPRVVFMKVDPSELSDPQERLKEQFNISEEKDFYPHLTLFRLRSQEAQEAFQNNLPDIERIVEKAEWKFPVEEVAIYGVDPSWPREGQKVLFRHAT